MFREEMEILKNSFRALDFWKIQFIFSCLKHTYMQIIIKMQRRPAKGLWQAASMQATIQ